MNQFQIYGENNQYLIIRLIKIHGFPDATCYSGGYGAEGSIIIKSGSYSAFGSLWISTGEIFIFKNQLNEIFDNCSGEAKLVNSEVDFEVSIKIENRGRVIIEGRYKEFPSIDNELIFFFESDQSYIVKTLEELNEIILKYGGMKGINNY
ncbi:WapI family immunity protein [Paenibacillus sp. FSL H8-0034]|uniref:WapI family immunity protein n=1 Tax=Paenibacillus sp. FSL H8-0034 TaxID=2954671 RepID=UPI0030FACE99